MTASRTNTNDGTSLIKLEPRLCSGARFASITTEKPQTGAGTKVSCIVQRQADSSLFVRQFCPQDLVAIAFLRPAVAGLKAISRRDESTSRPMPSTLSTTNHDRE